MTVKRGPRKFCLMLEDSSDSGSTRSPQYGKARAWLNEQADTILHEQVEIARTPAPPFQERARGELVAAKLRGIGIAAGFDDIGNILAQYPANGDELGERPVIVAAHLDTVFGPGTNVEVRRSGPRWVGPGIADNARGVAVAMWLLRALLEGRVEPQRPILFAFTVGEEGNGDLRGVKHLFSKRDNPLRDATAFIALDGSGLRRVVHRALGSRRFRITVRGPGGHSWADWGRPNPAHVIGELAHRLSDLELPRARRTTLTVARLGGGTNINAIPAENFLELDVRSESIDALDRTERMIRAALIQSIASEEARSQASLTAAIGIIGERPAGELSTSHPLLRAALEATKELGHEAEPSISSTDANVPLALGVPAIAIGGGGRSGNAHTVNEWFENTDGADGAVRALSLLASVAGF
ncbi:MAG: M20/M25/M40 family metallo-hydrolase [Gemmatimonadota bacterium]